MCRIKTRLRIAIFVSALVVMAGGAFAVDHQRNNPNGQNEIRPKICFYAEVNFKGRFFCEAGRRTVNMVEVPWRDFIKSIRVYGRASVQIYNEYSRNGDRDLITANVAELSPDFYNRVWSYRTGLRR